ncbi:MAG: hypothetical protein KF892_07565 [Rhizobacter sp.]|nr:hypothetical protein [Rhizobacter sp.]
MKFLDRLKLSAKKPDEDGPTLVTFTGGMGAQILSAAIYFDLMERGVPVAADLSYFDRPEFVAEAGQAGACSHWAWQLDPFGLARWAFSGDAAGLPGRARMIPDGAEKMTLAMSALEKPAIRARFQVPAGLQDLLDPADARPYMCLHVRRGDYLNVASHLVSDAEFVGLARRFAGLIQRVVILSDSDVPADFVSALQPHFDHVEVCAGIDAFASHRIMRGARVLVCSNSQFSLIAALLNPEAMVLVPRQWFDGKDRAIEAPIHARCAFQLLGADSAA